MNPTIDTFVTLIGVAYGVVLILSSFMQNRIVAAFRIDTFLMSKPTPATAKINIPFGLFILIYSVYSLYKSF
ncbi:MAG: hypothetical protein HY890_08620 [Deltaproteobacteria bacterium]|nr:hypothetical protein [Deltaproteobacteria bacterium]